MVIQHGQVIERSRSARLTFCSNQERRTPPTSFTLAVAP